MKLTKSQLDTLTDFIVVVWMDNISKAQDNT